MCATSRNHDMVTDPTIGQSADRPSSDMIPIRSVRLSHLPIDGFVYAFGDQRCLPGLIPTFCGDHLMKWIWLSTLLVVISFGANPGFAQTTPDDPRAIRAKGMKRICNDRTSTRLHYSTSCASSMPSCSCQNQNIQNVKNENHAT